MKKIWIGLFASLIFSNAVFALTKIMPFGDSITESTRMTASYRYWLWKSLQSANFEVDFVGSKYGVASGSPLYSDFGQNHEGHWGKRADELLPYVVQWASTYQPDIVLMHIGHNDIFSQQSISSTLEDIGQIIDAFRSVNPNIVILLARNIPSASHAAGIDELGRQIGVLSQIKKSEISPLIIVDQWTGFDARLDTIDGIHPNQQGEQKMAARWFDALRRVLNPLAAPDTNGDGCINDFDLLNVILDFGDAPSGLRGQTDVNGDGMVNDFDLTNVIFGFNTGCN